MIVVDSSIWIDWIRVGTGQIDTRSWMGRDPTEILLGDIVLLEVLQGARDDALAQSIERQMRRFRIVPMLDGHLASKAAANYRRLRSLGITIRKTPNVIIATYCIENDHLLLQRDRDFAPMAEHLGLRLA